MSLLKDIPTKYGMSILFTTPDIDQAYDLSDRILVMYQGEKVEKGSVEELTQEKAAS